MKDFDSYIKTILFCVQYWIASGLLACGGLLFSLSLANIIAYALGEQMADPKFVSWWWCCMFLSLSLLANGVVITYWLHLKSRRTKEASE